MKGLNPNPTVLNSDWLFDNRQKKIIKIERLKNNNKILFKLIDKNNQRIKEIQKNLDKKTKKGFIL